jgi:hypothetical protein
MKTHSHFPADAKETRSAPAPLKVPRLDSLLHRLRTAKDAGGQPIPLLDELLFFLDDPPQGTGDRWQIGADMCEAHGIKTSRMSVWRFYHANILQWRREQNPPPPAPPPTPEEIARLQEQATHLAALRVLDTLNDPALSPGHLIGLLQNQAHRQRIQLERDKFKDRVTVRLELDKFKARRAAEQDMRDELTRQHSVKALREFFERKKNSIPPHTT